MSTIKIPMFIRDRRTGKITSDLVDFNLANSGNDAGRCRECGTVHPAEQPHNLGSLAYQCSFDAEHGRRATWADAMAHCSPEVKEFWKVRLIALGAWSEPEEVAHA